MLVTACIGDEQCLETKHCLDDIVIYGNLFVGVETEIDIESGTYKIYNNTFTGQDSHFSIWAWDAHPYPGQSYPPERILINGKIYNNIFEHGSVNWISDHTAEADHNLYWNHGTPAQNKDNGPNSFEADPLFVDKAGRDFHLAYSPEREDPGNKDFTTATIPKVVGGLTKKCSEMACKLYGAAIVRTVPVSSLAAAEAAKILENVYRCVNIAMVNELKTVFDRMGIDVWEVINAASTKPFGFKAFYPGPGLGGHCIPIDPFYLTWKARQYGMPTRFIELAGEINTGMPGYVVNKTMEALNEHRKSLKGSKVLVLGLAYKKDIDDLRESPSIELIELLREKGAKVDYNDPYIPKTHKQRKHDLKMTSKKLSARMLFCRVREPLSFLMPPQLLLAMLPLMVLLFTNTVPQ